MPLSSKLPPDYVWRDEHGQQTLYLNDRPLARVRRVAAGWRAEILFDAPGVAAQQAAVRGPEYGRIWACRWVAQRQRLVATACGRPDLVPPVIHGPPRRNLAWQAPSWARSF